MNYGEQRALLVEQGALMLMARMKGAEAGDLLSEATREWLEAAEPLYAVIDSEGLLVTDPDEQEACFRESCELCCFDPEDEVFVRERASFERMRQTAARRAARLN